MVWRTGRGRLLIPSCRNNGDTKHILPQFSTPAQYVEKQAALQEGALLRVASLSQSLRREQELGSPLTHGVGVAVAAQGPAHVFQDWEHVTR